MQSFGEIGKIWHQGHGGIIWEFMEQHKLGLLHKPQIKGISLLIEKGIFGLGILVAWVRWISGIALERVGIKDHLSMKKKYAQVQVQRGAREPNQRQKREKPRKRKGCENQGVTNLPPLE